MPSVWSISERSPLRRPARGQVRLDLPAPQRVRGDELADPGLAGSPADDPPGSMPVQPSAIGQEHRFLSALPDGQVDRPDGPRRERNGHDLSAQPASQPAAPPLRACTKTGHQRPHRTGTGPLTYHLMLTCGLIHGIGTQNVRSCTAYGGHADHPVVVHRLRVRNLGPWRQRSVTGTADCGRRESSFASCHAGGLWPSSEGPSDLLRRGWPSQLPYGGSTRFYGGSTRRHGHLGWFARAAAAVRGLPGSSGRLSLCLPDDGAPRCGCAVRSWPAARSG